MREARFERIGPVLVTDVDLAPATTGLHRFGLPRTAKTQRRFFGFQPSHSRAANQFADCSRCRGSRRWGRCCDAGSAPLRPSVFWLSLMMVSGLNESWTSSFLTSALVAGPVIGPIA